MWHTQSQIPSSATAAAAERHEQHGPLGLRVEPVDAAGGGGGGGRPRQRADRVHRRAPRLGLAEHGRGAGLDGVECVHQNAGRVAVPLAVVHHPPVRVAGAVLERLQDVSAGHWHAAGGA